MGIARIEILILQMIVSGNLFPKTINFSGLSPLFLVTTLFTFSRLHYVLEVLVINLAESSFRGRKVIFGTVEFRIFGGVVPPSVNRSASDCRIAFQ